METLADWIRQKGPLTPPEAVGWAIRLAKHVESLHEHGVAHGNVSPACVLMGSSDPRTPGFMSDVRKTTESLPYHSPERVIGGQLSPPDDAWAIAATLYTALTAAPPFVGATDDELQEQVLKGSPAPLSVFGVEDAALDRLLAATFASDPSRRLSNVAQLRHELERLHPHPEGLVPLEDEEVGEEDQAATQMLNMMMDDEPATSSDAIKNLFTPPSYQPESRARPPSSRIEPSDPNALAAPAEQDATVMRALPAHIMALAARAASGSNPPPANTPPSAGPMVSPQQQAEQDQQAQQQQQQQQQQQAQEQAQQQAQQAQQRAQEQAQQQAHQQAEQQKQQMQQQLQQQQVQQMQQRLQQQQAPQQPSAPFPQPPTFGPGGFPGAAMARPTGAGIPPAPPSRPQQAARPQPIAPPVPQMSESEGDATRIAPAPDLAAALRAVQQSGESNAMPPPQLGSPFADVPRPGAPGPMRPVAPRPGFANPPPSGPGESVRPPDPDDVRTVMHAGDQIAALLQQGPPPGARPIPAARPSAPNVGAPALARPVADLSDEDEDDGARTVMREGPMVMPDMGRQAPKPIPAGGGWQPAAPPAPGPQGGPLGGQPAFAKAAAPPAFPGGPQNLHQQQQNQQQQNQQHNPLNPQNQHGPHNQPGQGLMGGGVSALIQEALAEGPTSGSDAGQSPPGGSLASSLGVGSSLSSIGANASQLPMMSNLGQQSGQGFDSQPAAFPTPPQGFPQTATGPGPQLSQGAIGPGGMPELSPTGYPIGAGISEPIAKKKRGAGGLILVCLLVLVLAAAVTFIVLKYRVKLGIPPLHF